jgi:hypothetical protein
MLPLSREIQKLFSVTASTPLPLQLAGPGNSSALVRAVLGGRQVEGGVAVEEAVGLSWKPVQVTGISQ